MPDRQSAWERLAHHLANALRDCAYCSEGKALEEYERACKDENVLIQGMFLNEKQIRRAQARAAKEQAKRAGKNYVPCPACRKEVCLTSTGSIRYHKPSMRSQGGRTCRGTGVLMWQRNGKWEPVPLEARGTG